MKIWQKTAAWIFITYFLFGFRTTPDRWDITVNDPTLWLKVCATNSATIEENDITGDDVLAGVANPTFTQVLQTVIDDYNSVPSSYLRLALYPADPANPGAPLAGDSTFTVDVASKRTIEICFGETDVAAGLSGGYAMPQAVGGQMIKCEVKSKPEHAHKAQRLVHLLTHEIGHCLSLMHPQEGTRAVMSYFGERKLRLQDDDAAGLTFQYPTDESYGKETPTMGLSGCAPRD